MNTHVTGRPHGVAPTIVSVRETPCGRPVNRAPTTIDKTTSFGYSSAFVLSLGEVTSPLRFRNTIPLKEEREMSTSKRAKTILLVASVPDPRQHPDYYSRNVNMDVREAVVGLCRCLQDEDDPKLILWKTNSSPAIGPLIERLRLEGFVPAIRFCDDLVNDVDVAFFVGGTPDEVPLFGKLLEANVRTIPIPTTGIGASEMFEAVESQFTRELRLDLKTNFLYWHLFQKCLRSVV